MTWLRKRKMMKTIHLEILEFQAVILTLAIEEKFNQNFCSISYVENMVLRNTFIQRFYFSCIQDLGISISLLQYLF